MRVYIAVYRDGWTNELQVNLETDDYGYRLLGPKFNGSGKLLHRAKLDEKDRDQITQMLAKMEMEPHP